MDKSGCVDQTPVMKLSLNVLIACSAVLQQCIPGGVIWKSISLELGYLWKAVEYSLSSLMYAGSIPLVSRCSCRSLNTCMNSMSDIAFMGRIIILLIP